MQNSSKRADQLAAPVLAADPLSLTVIGGYVAAMVHALEARGGLKGYEPLPAVRADLLRRLGRRDAASEAYQAATSATQLEPLRRFYARRIADLD